VIGKKACRAREHLKAYLWRLVYPNGGEGFAETRPLFLLLVLFLF